IIVVGAGPSAVECAGQLATTVGRARRQRRRAGKRVRKTTADKKEGGGGEKAADEQRPLDSINVTLISGHDSLLPGQDDKVGVEAERLLKSAGVNIMHG